jgi:hypothetical protein
VQSWLLVERIENWRIDKAEGFSRFGLPARKEKMAADIRKGDLLFFYVSSGISRFSDIRRATQDGYAQLRHGGEYDTAFPIALQTEPVLTLPEPTWLPFKEVADRLSFSKGKDWRQIMRSSLRRLGEQDANLIRARMEEQASD